MQSCDTRAPGFDRARWLEREHGAPGSEREGSVSEAGRSPDAREVAGAKERAGQPRTAEAVIAVASPWR